MSMVMIAACRGKSGAKAPECLKAFVCAAACQTDDCLQGCVDGTSDEARALMEALATCAEEHGCTDASATACLKASCGAELDACMR